MGEVREIIRKSVEEGDRCLCLISLDLQELPHGVFSDCDLSNSSITCLKLDFNDLQCLPDDLQSLANLRQLYAIGNQLTSLPDTISDLKNLEELHLNENILEQLSLNLGKVSKLRVLNLTGNQIENWRDEFGSGLCSLTELRIDENNLTELPDSFASMKCLKVIELGDNHLQRLPENFGNLSSLEVLNMSHNDVEKLPESFGHLSNLRSLDITGNHIEHLPDEFECASKLQHFYADNNSFKILPHWFEKLGNIINISLSDNELIDMALPAKFGTVSGKTLETLDLSGNKITMLPESMGELVELKSLHLGSTINELERRAFQNGNWLPRLPDTFSLMASLTKIHLDENQLVCIPEDFGNLMNLEWLDLGQNRIDHLPDSFCSLRKLWFLQLSKNHLVKLPENFGNLTSLVELRLDSNMLTSLPASFAKLQNVKTLDLFSNQLSEIPKVLLMLKKLTRLDLDRNKLKIKADKVPKLTTKVHYAPRDPNLKDNWRGKLREDKLAGEVCRESIAELLEKTEELDNGADIEEEEEELVYSEAALERAMRRGLSIWRSHTGPDEREVDSEYTRNLTAPSPPGSFVVNSPSVSSEMFEDAAEEKIYQVQGSLPTQNDHHHHSSHSSGEDWDLEVEDSYIHAPRVPATKLTDLHIRNQLQCLISSYPPAAQAFTRSAKYESVYPDLIAAPGDNTHDDDGQFDDADS